MVKTESIDEECLEVADIVCHVCCVTVQSFTIQSELKRFLQQQEAGLDVLFKCSRCHDCKDCKRGAGQEMTLIRQEAEQEKIRESIHIDRTQNRLIAKLPFLCDPSEKLKDNTKAATKRLENVVRQYGSDENVKLMLQKSMQKLINNEHIVLLHNLPVEKQEEILNSKSSYTIPADIAFKEASV